MNIEKDEHKQGVSEEYRWEHLLHWDVCFGI